MFKSKDAPVLNPDRVDTIIGKETEFKGTIKSHGVLRIDGRVEGEIIHQGDLVVGAGGVVVANLHARNVTIAGEVKGNVDADGRLDLVASARLTGDVRVNHLVIEEGAIFLGTSAMRSEDRGAQKPEPKPAPPR
jgi:cytoskeletal protein CcmA (bactofilin family)